MYYLCYSVRFHLTRKTNLFSRFSENRILSLAVTCLSNLLDIDSLFSTESRIRQQEIK